MITPILAASALSLASPTGNPGGWLNDDYPAGALKRKEEGPVGFRLLIDPKGRVERCSITSSSGSSDLDGATCNIIVALSRFKPATNEADQPNYSEYAGRLTWRIPGTARPIRRERPPAPSPVMELTVQTLPNGERQKMIELIARFDAAGQIAACEPSPTNPQEVKLATVACAQARALPSEIIRDKEGNPVSVIRSLNIQFKTAQ